jgi:hypothetical protein
VLVAEHEEVLVVLAPCSGFDSESLGQGTKADCVDPSRHWRVGWPGTGIVRGRRDCVGGAPKDGDFLYRDPVPRWRTSGM